MDDVPATLSRPRARPLLGVLVAGLWGLGAGGVGVAAALLRPVRSLAAVGVDASVRPSDVIELLPAVLLVSLGAILVLRGSAGRYGWLVLCSGVVVGVGQGAAAYSLWAEYGAAVAGGPWPSLAVWLQDLWMLWWLAVVLLFPALFPDGRAVGRWRWPVLVTTIAWGGLIGLYLVARRPAGNAFVELPNPPTNPAGVVAVPMDAVNTAWAGLTVISVGIAVGSLVSRWRIADADRRQQIKWVLYAFGVAATVMAAAIVHTVIVETFGADFGVQWLVDAALPLAWAGVALALGLGVLRYRLYDVDLVINRTIVYGVMTALIVAGYVAVVGGVAAVMPAADRRGLSLLATGLVAVAFNPVRHHVQQRVNRLMFGRRDDPYAVVSELGSLLARSPTPDATLRTAVETIAAALKLPGVAVDIVDGDEWQTHASTGTVADDREGIPLRHQGRLVGRMVVARRSPAQALHGRDRELLESLAPHVAALVHGIGLTAALQRSREQLVLAREEERRRLRRDLHDGLGPSLASQTFRLDAILELVDDNPDAAALVRTLKHHNQQLVAEIRRLVYELRPPTLDELGLAGAVAAHAGQLARAQRLMVDVVTEPDPLPDLPAALEVAAYRIACEAITNVVRHAQASTCIVRVEVAAGRLTIDVRDDGVGIRHVTRPGIGMTSMRERAEELGGSLLIEHRHSPGTRVVARLPLDTQTAGHGTITSLAGLPHASTGQPAVGSTDG